MRLGRPYGQVPDDRMLGLLGPAKYGGFMWLSCKKNEKKTSLANNIAVINFILISATDMTLMPGKTGSETETWKKYIYINIYKSI